MWPFRRVFRLGMWIFSGLTLLALPLVVWDFSRRGYAVKYQAWFIGGIFVILSIPISVYEVAMHTEYYTRPRLQRHVIRILWMVPIYGLDAWFALRFRDAREYLDPVRECYEAYVIYNFFAYLMAYLEDELGDVDAYMATKPPMRHLPPFKWVLKRWTMGNEFLLECKKGVMNYVILRPVCTTIAFITDAFGVYGQGKFTWRKSYVYLITVTNFSQLWALYCLAQLYWACHKELGPIRPLSKFMCIKAVVFLTFWQGVILAILVSSGVITDESWSTYDQLGVAAGIQDFLICIEMFVAALAHAYAFPPKDYMDPAIPTKGFLHNVKHMFDLRDVVEDMGEVMESHVDTAARLPKKAVKTAAKGFKAAVQAPESLLSLLTATDDKRGRKGSPGGLLSGGEEDDDEGEDLEEQRRPSRGRSASGSGRHNATGARRALLADHREQEMKQQSAQTAASAPALFLSTPADEPSGSSLRGLSHRHHSRQTSRDEFGAMQGVTVDLGALNQGGELGLMASGAPGALATQDVTEDPTRGEEYLPLLLEPKPKPKG